MQKINLYFTRAFGTQYHFIQSLRTYMAERSINIFVVVSHPDPSSLSLLAADLPLLEPHYDAVQNIDFYKQTCLDHSIDCLIPGESSLITIAKHEAFFYNNGVRVMSCSDLETLNILQSKTATYQYFGDTHLRSNIPDFHYVRTASEFIVAYDSLKKNGHQICFKPDVAQGGQGFRIIDEQLNSFFDFFGFPSVRNTYAYHIEILSSLPYFPPLIVCQYLPDTEFTIDCMGYDDKLYFSANRMKSKSNRKIVHHPALQNFARDVQSMLQLSYQYNIQVRFSGEQFYLLEINPRYAAGSYVYAVGGVNLLGSCLEKLLLNVEFKPLQMNPQQFISLDTYFQLESLKDSR